MVRCYPDSYQLSHKCRTSALSISAPPIAVLKYRTNLFTQKIASSPLNFQFLKHIAVNAQGTPKKLPPYPKSNLSSPNLQPTDLSPKYSTTKSTTALLSHPSQHPKPKPAPHYPLSPLLLVSPNHPPSHLVLGTILAPNNGAFNGVFSKLGINDIKEAKGNPEVLGALRDTLLNHFFVGEARERESFGKVTENFLPLAATEYPPETICMVDGAGEMIDLGPLRPGKRLTLTDNI